MSNYQINSISYLSAGQTKGKMESSPYPAMVFMSVNGMDIKIELDTNQHDIMNLTVREIGDRAYAKYLSKR